MLRQELEWTNLTNHYSLRQWKCDHSELGCSDETLSWLKGRKKGSCRWRFFSLCLQCSSVLTEAQNPTYSSVIGGLLLLKSLWKESLEKLHWNKPIVFLYNGICSHEFVAMARKKTLSKNVTLRCSVIVYYFQSSRLYLECKIPILFMTG